MFGRVKGECGQSEVSRDKGARRGWEGGQGPVTQGLEILAKGWVNAQCPGRRESCGAEE